MRMVIGAVLLVAAVVMCAYLVIPGPTSARYLRASLERETGSATPVLGADHNLCVRRSGNRWRCRIRGRQGNRRIAYTVRMREHGCWTAHPPRGRPVEGCIHLLEPRIF